VIGRAVANRFPKPQPSASTGRPVWTLHRFREAALNPALAAETLAVSAWRKLIYSLIWQSVMWRPGKLRFLIGVKNPLPIRPAATAGKLRPLRGRAVRQIRDFSRATPSFRHEPGDTFSP
jgi:hypothetical protein